MNQSNQDSDITSAINGNNNNNNINGSHSTSSRTYQNVTHKKQVGTLILTDDAFTFYPFNDKNNNNGKGNDMSPIKQSWSHVIKHQVSPVTHAKHLLKIIIQPNTANKPKNSVFEFKTRHDIEQIRKDVSNRLVTARKIQALNNHNQSSSSSSTTAVLSRKRNHEEFINSQTLGTSITHNDNNGNSLSTNTTMNSLSSNSSYTNITKSQFKVASSSLLASYPTLRKQHSYLLQHKMNVSNGSTTNTETPIIQNESDFWSTHSIQQSNQLSKIIGVTQRGLPSTIKSSLDIQITTNAASVKSKGNSKAKDSKNDENVGSSSSNPQSSSISHSMNFSNSAITLGVEEMKQIFIMYPAVHAAYEEKVPLELSEELFWRKYLESEYFHRDRGRLGMSAKTAALEQNHQGGKNNKKKGREDDNDDDDKEYNANVISGASNVDKDDNDDKKDDKMKADDGVRVATTSSNDIFSRKEFELQRVREKQQQGILQNETLSQNPAVVNTNEDHILNRQIAIGQFDLTATANTERGSKLLLQSNADIYPSNDCGKKIIEKYNKHWSMVLNPNEAEAGCDLKKLARNSVMIALEGDNDAKASGGNNEEMERLVSSAIGHAVTGNNDTFSDNHFYYGNNVLFEELQLKNIDAYSGQTLQSGDRSNSNVNASMEKQWESDIAFSNVVIDQVKALVDPIISSKPSEKITDALPDVQFGKMLLVALTKKLVEDSKSEKDTVKMTNELPVGFREKFTKYFRRSSELLRHFYALRRMMENSQKRGAETARTQLDDKTNQLYQKINRIVSGLVDVYREMESMRDELPSSEQGETMRKVFKPIMEQLDWASKLHKDGLMSSSGPKKSGGFGFVEVTD